MSELPVGWAEARLSDVTELKYGKSLPAKARAGGPVQVYGSNGQVGNHAEAVTKGPTIVVGRKGSIGEIHFSDAPCFPIDTTYFIDEFHGMPPKFLELLLKSLKLTERNRASAIPGLNRDDAYSSVIALPPLDEQGRIVAKLDSLRARSSRARHELDRIPILIERYKQAILAKAFSGELTEEWRARHGLCDWKSGIAEPYFIWASGKFLPKSKQNAGPIPVYGGNGPNGLHDTALVAGPTLVIGRVGAHCGNVHLTSGPAWVTDNAIYASEIAAAIDPRYALLVFRNANLNAAAGGSGQPFVNQTVLNKTDFPLPDLAEQKEIVRLIQLASTWLDKIATEHARAEHLLPKLDQAILAKAFRGELVPQDPNDEPVSALLERIKAEGAGADQPKRRRARA